MCVHVTTMKVWVLKVHKVVASSVFDLTEIVHIELI
jgi:hypothetical protein